MISTGITALDQRLGGLAPNRYYLVSGGAGTGKTSMALHFLGAGLEAGERCALLTQDDPEDLLAQAEYLGYDLRPAAESDRLVVLQYRLDFAHNYARVADPERVLRELQTHLDGEPPSRLVIDSVLPFLNGQMAREPSEALAYLLERLAGTIYLTVPGDPAEGPYWAGLDRIRAAAAGIFHLTLEAGGVRELSIRKLRQVAASTEPIRFALRAGIGIVAESDRPRSLEELPVELRRRVVVLHLSGTLPGDLLEGLRLAYQVDVFESLETAFGELSAGCFGVLLIAFDPHQPRAAITLARELRKAGSGVPVLFYTASRELRSSTRTKALRAGGDDLFTDQLDVQEILERVEVARVRGHRPPVEAERADSAFVQPVGEDGQAVPVDEAELRRAVQYQIEQAGHPFFALVFLRPPPYSVDDTWRVLCEHLRVREGDLVGCTGDGRVAVYLHDINRRNVKELLMRIVQSHPELAGVRDVEVYSYPVDRTRVRAWLDEAPALPEARVEG